MVEMYIHVFICMNPSLTDVIIIHVLFDIDIDEFSTSNKVLFSNRDDAYFSCHDTSLGPNHNMTYEDPESTSPKPLTIYQAFHR